MLGINISNAQLAAPENGWLLRVMGYLLWGVNDQRSKVWQPEVGVQKSEIVGLRPETADEGRNRENCKQ